MGLEESGSAGTIGIDTLFFGRGASWTIGTTFAFIHSLGGGFSVAEIGGGYVGLRQWQDVKAHGFG